MANDKVKGITVEIGGDTTGLDAALKEINKGTEELYRRDLHNQENHNGVIIHLEPDILDCKVEWALGSITTNKVEVMEFQLSYFKS